MKTKPFFGIVFFCALALGGVFSGCGGGGSGDGNDFTATIPGGTVPTSYTGNTEQATITPNNVVAIVQNADAYGFITEPVEIAYDIMERNLILYNPRDISGLRVDSDCGGYYEFEMQLDESTGFFTGNITFAEFCVDWWESDLTLNGSLPFEGSLVYADAGYTFILELTLTNVSAQTTDDSLTFTYGTEAYEYTEDPTQIDVLYNLNYVVRNNANQDKTYWADNMELLNHFVIVSRTGASALRGRFYDNDFGYVDIDTIFSAVKSPEEFFPAVMIFTGLGSAARLTVNADGSTFLEVDTDNDGAFDDGSFSNVL